MKLKKPIVVDEKKFNQLQALDMKFLLFREALMIISDFQGEVIEETQTTFVSGLWPFRKTKKESVLKYQITHIKLWGWNHEKMFWGTFDENDVRFYLNYWNFPYFRKKFESILSALYAVGWKLEKNPKSPFDEGQTHNYD